MCQNIYSSKNYNFADNFLFTENDVKSCGAYEKKLKCICVECGKEFYISKHHYNLFLKNSEKYSCKFCCRNCDIKNRFNITENIKNDLLLVKDFIESGNADSLMSACVSLKKDYNKIYKANNILKIIKISTKNNGKTNNFKNSLNEKRKIKTIDLKNVIDMYYNQKMNFFEIGKRYNCSAATVLYYFRENNLTPRTKSENFELLKKSEKYNDWLNCAKEKFTNLYLNRRLFGTKPEIEFKNWLRYNKIVFFEQWRKVGNGHPYDFFLPEYNLIVEIDGHYWHQKEKQKKKDKDQLDFAKQKGYNIVRIDTEELKNAKGNYNLWLNIL